jgi:hypothetical protein
MIMAAIAAWALMASAPMANEMIKQALISVTAAPSVS